MKQSTVNRLNKELAELSTNPPENSSVSLAGDNLSQWTLHVVGPAGTPYEGGNFQLSIAVPDNYPFKPPEVKFTTRIYHPNVKSDDGSICADVYQTNWAPTLNIRYVIDTVLSIMLQPNADHAVEPEIAQLMLADEGAYLARAREWTQNYAQ
jgi:ubiquitin-conjugating enzyme E2 D/E